MRFWHRGIVEAALACAVGLATVVPAYGIVGEPYPYKVRVFEGNRGNIVAPADSDYEVKQYDTYIEFTVPANSEFTLNRAWDKVLSEYSDLYYVKGFRLAGEDYGTDNRLSNLNFVVNEDMDYVIAYGVQGEMVSYQVVYIDNATGAEIGRSETYYGNVGDKPVVAYEHIPGYRPMYRNITGTLSEGVNEWKLPYTKIETPTSTTTDSSSSTSTSTSTSTTGSSTTTSTVTTSVPTTTTTTSTTETSDDTDNANTTSSVVSTDDSGNDSVSSEIITPSDIKNDSDTGTQNSDSTSNTSSSEPESILDTDNPLVHPDQFNHEPELNPEPTPAVASDYMVVKVLLGLLAVVLIILFILWRRHKAFFDDIDDDDTLDE